MTFSLQGPLRAEVARLFCSSLTRDPSSDDINVILKVSFVYAFGLWCKV